MLGERGKAGWAPRQKPQEPRTTTIFSSPTEVSVHLGALGVFLFFRTSCDQIQSYGDHVTKGSRPSSSLW